MGFVAPGCRRCWQGLGATSVRWRKLRPRSLVEAGRSVTELRLDGLADRWWRAELIQGAEALGTRPLRTRLAHVAQQLRFLAQGPGPFLLACGSRRVDPASPLGRWALPLQSVAVSANETQILGGAGNLQPAPDPGRPRLYLLWTVIGLAGLLFVGMALGVLRRLRQAADPNN